MSPGNGMDKRNTSIKGGSRPERKRVGLCINPLLRLLVCSQFPKDDFPHRLEHHRVPMYLHHLSPHHARGTKSPSHDARQRYHPYIPRKQRFRADSVSARGGTVVTVFS